MERREICQETFRNPLAYREIAEFYLIHDGITKDIPISRKLIPTNKLFPVAWCHGNLADFVQGWGDLEEACLSLGSEKLRWANVNVAG